jgi:hypothetical protein
MHVIVASSNRYTESLGSFSSEDAGSTINGAPGAGPGGGAGADFGGAGGVNQKTGYRRCILLFNSRAQHMSIVEESRTTGK